MSRLLLLFLPLLQLLHPSSSLNVNLTLYSFSSSNSPWLPKHNLTLRSLSSTFAASFLPVRSSSSLFTFSVYIPISNTTVWSLRPSNSSSPLSISPDGILSLHGADGKSLLYHTTSPKNSTLRLLDDGSLTSGEWTSFSSPTDTILPNQPIPSQDITLSSNLYKLINASTLQFNGSPNHYWSSSSPFLNLTTDGLLMLLNKQPILTANMGSDDVLLRRLTLDPDGNLRIYSLGRNTSRWIVVWRALCELCAIHGTCGEGFICEPDSGSPVCKCPPGYTNRTSKCVPKIPSLEQPKFLPMDYVDYDQPSGLVDTLYPVDLAECESSCRSKSTCMAFGYKLDGNRSCIHRSSPLVNGRWSPVTRITTYIKVSGAETDESKYTSMTTVVDVVCPESVEFELPTKERKNTVRNTTILGVIFAVELLGGFMAFWAFLRRFSEYRDMARTFGLDTVPVGGTKRFSYAELMGATGNFSKELGRGGFGVVYKGELPDGRSIAVKRLKDVARGEMDFWAEVTIIARMHHLNLVRLWGFCTERHQRMLVYEYVPSGSLSKHLFDPPGPVLGWNLRYRIAVGVARAIAYLHEECFEWVLHCDIKPENILLMDDFCPKVSDFGLAKLANKEEKVKMSTMRGTRGYIAPELLTSHEPVTAKADVYSFGMVLLDLVIGRRHSDFKKESLQSEDCYFPSWAFEKVFEEGTLEEVMDERIAQEEDDGGDKGACFETVERMVKTAMWCLQDRPEVRPSMGKVVKMLEGTVEITRPDKIILALGGPILA